MLLNESKGSFEIEGETPARNRLERWGRMIAEAKDVRLSIPALEALHRSLFDGEQVFTAMGLRQEGGFVGRHDGRDETPIPDHVSARPEDLPSLLTGMISAFERIKRARFDPVLTAVLIGFGFVFIHPFEDGNGRLHRFPIQKALVDDAKRRVAALVDLADRRASLLIRFCAQNGGRLSKRKQEEFFSDLPADVIAELEEAIGASGIVGIGDPV